MSIRSFDISASGMRAQRLRMELIAVNLANSETTSASQSVESDAEGNRSVRHHPYRRKVALFEVGGVKKGDRMWGVSTPRVVEDPTDLRAEDNPGHAHAVRNRNAADFGKVYHPNVNPIVEMVDMIAASRAYEANVTAVDTLKGMNAASLRILA